MRSVSPDLPTDTNPAQQYQQPPSFIIPASLKDAMPSESETPRFDLAPLENLIKSELAYWMSYLQEVQASSRNSFAEMMMMSDPTSTPQTSTPPPTTMSTIPKKIQALRHILETLPLRHKALADAYAISSSSPSSAVEEDLHHHHQQQQPWILTGRVAELFRDLGEEEMSGELEGFFEGSFGKGRKVWREVVAIEKEVRNLEDERLQTLKGLLEVLEMCVIVGVA